MEKVRGLQTSELISGLAAAHEGVVLTLPNRHVGYSTSLFTSLAPYW